MADDYADQEPSLRLEDVERRGEPRGLMRDLRVRMGQGDDLAVLEASRKGLFVEVDDPEAFRLGDEHDISVRRITDELALACRIEVVRKELRPRRGIALRIVRIAAVAEETLKAMLADA